MHRRIQHTELDRAPLPIGASHLAAIVHHVGRHHRRLIVNAGTSRNIRRDIRQTRQEDIV